MRLQILDLHTTESEQLQKVLEEVIEVIKAKTLDEKLEEAFDVIQATVGYIRNIATQEQIERGNLLHRLKLQQRECQGGFRVTKEYSISEVEA